MLKKLAVVIALVSFFGLVVSCGPAIDQDLVGVWECTETTSVANRVGSVVKFTEDGKMGASILGVDNYDDLRLVYDYEAKDGKVTYWFPEYPDITMSIVYTVSGNTLNITTSGAFQGKYKRVQ
jgi:hypothetical protein